MFSFYSLNELIFLFIYSTCLAMFIVSSYFSWNLYNGIYLPVKQASMPGPSEQKSIHGIASIIIGIISVEVAMGLPPVGVALGAIAILLGLRAKRKRDKYGLGGIVLGVISIAIAIIYWIVYFSYWTGNVY